MRGMRWYVVNKETGKGIFTDFRKTECQKFLAGLADKENYAIGYKWLSL